MIRIVVGLNDIIGWLFILLLLIGTTIYCIFPSHKKKDGAENEH